MNIGRDVADVLADLDLDHQQFARAGRGSLFGDAYDAIRQLAATLAAITALATAALAERRRGCPTYGLVSAAQIQRIVEEAKA